MVIKIVMKLANLVNSAVILSLAMYWMRQVKC